MNRLTKKAQGQLLDMSSKALLSEGLVSITRFDARNAGDRPSYELTLMVDGYKPDLADKSHFLKLSDDLIGEVFISISTDQFPGQETLYDVKLQDSIWIREEWFDKL